MGHKSQSAFDVRPARSTDVQPMLAILNDIIDIGGTTAFQNPLTPQEFRQYFLDARECLVCFVALNSNDMPLGFQSLRTKASLGKGWIDIATFTQRNSGIKGVGRRLFQSTVEFARAQNMSSINATIRADNVPGLGYYTKMGFVDYATSKGVPLADGTPVDRISKVYAVEHV